MSDVLGIPARIEVAVDYLMQSNETISISKVCKIAEVNRSNLYVTYPYLIKKIRSLQKPNSPKFKKMETKSKQKPAHDITHDVAVLSHACLELRFALDEALQENKFLKAELADARAAFVKRRSKQTRAD